MLIINADDFGRDEFATDRALYCHRMKRITSTTAMVFMQDSERASHLAHESHIDVGLHINFSQPFTSNRVPTRLRECHARVAKFLKINKLAPIFFHPFLINDFRYCFEVQYSEFLRLFGHPSHFDGHQHLHLSTNVLIGRFIPAGAKVRRSFTFAAGEKSFVNRLYRHLVDRLLAKRHPITNYFFSLAHQLTPVSLERVVTLSCHANVELMTHPALPREFDFLTSDFFGSAISKSHLASYVKL